MRLTWNDDALDELERIKDYIEEDDPFAAARVVLRLHEGIEQLAAFPNLGRTGRVAETRELIFPDLRYIAVYRVHAAKDEVEILTVIHTARKYPPD